VGLAVDLGTSARAMQVCEFSWRVLFGFGWVGGKRVVGGGALRNARAWVVDWIDFF